jgi:hypothetical protein
MLGSLATVVRAVALALALVVVSACDLARPAGLAIATTWPAEARVKLEAGFQAWCDKSGVAVANKAFPIAWLTLEPAHDPSRLPARKRPPDVLLGLTVPSLERLEKSGRLEPLANDGTRGWLVLKRTENAPVETGFDDPRRDPAILDRALEWLDDSHFASGYERLIRFAATGKIGAIPTSAPDRGRPEEASVEGVAVLRSPRSRELALAFLKFLEEIQQAAHSPLAPRPADGRAYESLVADLVGATLVDAHDELTAAWVDLEKAGFPETPFRYMIEPPPWPPASISKILDRQGDTAMTMLDTLAKEVAPDPATDAWLVRSWIAPPRLINRDMLMELVNARDGMLLEEPRFRSWLRAEWTAWARQRYRRVRKLLTMTAGAGGSTKQGGKAE